MFAASSGLESLALARRSANSIHTATKRPLITVKKPGSQPCSRLKKEKKGGGGGVKGRGALLSVFPSFVFIFWRVLAKPYPNPCSEPFCLGYRTTNTFFFTCPSSHGMESPLATWYLGPSSRERLLRVQKLHEQAFPSHLGLSHVARRSRRGYNCARNMLLADFHLSRKPRINVVC